MKLRNIFTILAAALAFAFVGCQEEERFLDEVKVSQSFVAIPVEGGSTEITVNAAADWAIAGVPEWLTVSPASGSAGETKVTFSAAKTSATNEAILELSCAGKTQLLTVYQMAEKVEVPLSSCKDVINGVDGVVYRVKGTVTSIANTLYGNWYLQDETGTVYVYGTLYEGAEKQFDKLDSKAIKDFTGALKDMTLVLRNLHNLPTQAEAEAQRIAAERLKLEQRKADAAEKAGEVDKSIIVRLEGDLEAYAK